MQETNKVLDGVGQDAEIVTNEQGGKQSKSPMALHLVDPKFLEEWAKEEKELLCFIYKEHGLDKNEGIYKNELYSAIQFIAEFMQTSSYALLKKAMVSLKVNNIDRLVSIAKVLQYGVDRYEPNNWRLIPQEQHVNHALIHILAEIVGDTQDNHIDHALCRLMMAMATSPSPNFSYTDYVLPKGDIAEVPSDHPDFKPIVKCKYKYDCDYKE